MKRHTFLLTLGIALLLTCTGSAAAHAQAATPDAAGWLAWHRYRDYMAKDSVLTLRVPNGTQTTIEGDLIHPMNADFGSHPYDLVFMAIDPSADEWDVFRGNLLTGVCVNITANSGFRNEDPKFSPDGMRLVFKRGVWDFASDSFRYDLAELDLRTGTVTRLTDTPEEESMPDYSSDGKTIYFVCQTGAYSQIHALDRATGERRVLFAQDGCSASYPIAVADGLYFTKQQTPDNPNDCIMQYHDTEVERLPFANEVFNCSDPCPLPDGNLIYSCSAAGDYDLYVYDGERSSPLNALNTDRQELGAAFYAKTELVSQIGWTQKFLLRQDVPMRNYDADGNGSVDALDLCVLKRAALGM